MMEELGFTMSRIELTEDEVSANAKVMSGITTAGAQTDEQAYLDLVLACERKSLEVSKASKALNQLNAELGKLYDQRKLARLKCIGDDPHAEPTPRSSPWGGSR